MSSKMSARFKKRHKSYKIVFVPSRMLTRVSI